MLAVTPLQALGGSVEASHDQVPAARAATSGRSRSSSPAAALLAAASLGASSSPLGVVVAFVGGLLSFTDSRSARRWSCRRCSGSSGGCSVARRPRGWRRERASLPGALVAHGDRSRDGRHARHDVRGRDRVGEGGDDRGGRRGAAAPRSPTVLDSFAAIMMGLVGVSAVIAGVGLVNLLTIGVVQRRRELGLLRALGVSNGQVRRMVLFEAAHVTIAATRDGPGARHRLRLGGSAVAARLHPGRPRCRAGIAFVWPAVPLCRSSRSSDRRLCSPSSRRRADAPGDPRRAGRGARRIGRRGEPRIRSRVQTSGHHGCVDSHGAVCASTAREPAALVRRIRPRGRAQGRAPTSAPAP